MKPYITSLATMWVSFAILTGQDWPIDDTHLGANQLTYENSFVPEKTQLEKLNRTLNLSVYIVKNEEGEAEVDMADLNAAITGLNAAFDPIALSFRIAATHTVDNYHLNTITRNEAAGILRAQYATAKTINLYLVNTILLEPDTVCGFTFYPADFTDAIVLNKSCLEATVLIRLMGTFLNLYKTNETAFGAELVSGANCTTSGDRCCDTPADPGLRGLVEQNCSFFGSGIDSQGNGYAPTTANYMAESLQQCKCFFSDCQYLRMINCLYMAKKHLW